MKLLEIKVMEDLAHICLARIGGLWALNWSSHRAARLIPTFMILSEVRRSLRRVGKACIAFLRPRYAFLEIIELIDFTMVTALRLSF